MMTGSPQLEFYPRGKGRFKVTKGFSAQVGRMRVAVPIGTITNGATIPSFLWPVLSPYDPEWFIASIVHDGLVGEFNDPVKARDIITGEEKVLTWKESAQFMRGLMKTLNAPRYKRHLFYHAMMAKKRINYWLQSS